MNTKLRAGLAVAALSLLALAGCAQSGGTGTAPYGSSPSKSSPSSSSSTPAPTQGETMLSTTSSSLGTIVVDSTGMTVYVFDKDTANSGTSTCEGECLANWPAVTTTTMPSGTGVDGTIGTITRSDGSMQVTLNGLPLYRYAGDSAAGDTNGQGVGGIWWVVGPDGNKITQTASSGSGGY